jgi:hypothetical protein
MTPEAKAALISDLVSEVTRLRALINAPEHLLPLPANPDCRFLIEFREADDGDDVDAYWIWVEGSSACCAEADVDHALYVLYKLFEGVTHVMALELAGPVVAGRDRRRDLFRHQEDLLQLLDPEWANQTRERHQHILRTLPFADDLG